MTSDVGDHGAPCPYLPVSPIFTQGHPSRGPRQARFWLVGVEAGVPGKPDLGLLGWKPGLGWLGWKPGLGLLGWNVTQDLGFGQLPTAICHLLVFKDPAHLGASVDSTFVFPFQVILSLRLGSPHRRTLGLVLLLILPFTNG
jgi:hypothetical protein